MKIRLNVRVVLCLVASVLFTLGSRPAFATPNPCPTPTGTVDGGPDLEGLSAVYTGDIISSGGATCNVLITFNANGSITTSFPNAAPSYDSGGDDNLVGIINNTASAITAINLTSASDDIYGFDGDGICSTDSGYYSFTTNACAGVASTSASTGDGYAGPGVTYTNITNANRSGTVDFSGGIAANGGTSFFSLEGPVDVNLGITPSATTPEPGSLVLLGTGVLSMVGMIRRRLADGRSPAA